MVNGRVSFFGVAGLVTSLGLAACGGGAQDIEAKAEAVVALSTVPPDVGCVAITVAGKVSSQSRFDVVAGQPAQLRMSGLPVGPASFVGEAFDGPCAQVSTGAIASWVGEPVSALLSAGKTSFVQLVLRPNGRATVAIDFKLDPQTGEPCVGSEPGCLDPEDAVGKAGSLLPAGARLIGTAEFVRGLQEGNIHLSSPRIEARAEALENEAAERARDLVLKALEARPELSYWAKPVQTDAETRPAAGGNFEIDITNTLGERQTVMTMSDRWTLNELADTLTRFPSQGNQLRIYESLFDNLPVEFRRQNQLPDPKQLANVSADELLRVNVSLADRIKEITIFVPPEGFPPSGYPKTCDEEELTPSPATDQTGGSCSPTGLWKNASFFPLRWRATCVKNQARRGTCVAFGIAAAVETAVAVKHNRWLNLSEQRLYYKYKVPAQWGDGLGTVGVMTDLAATGWVFPFEPRWDYNPSSSRINVPPLPPAPNPPLPGTHYEQSCTGYFGEHCSNTSHQGDVVCINVIGLTFCATDGSAPSDSGFRMTSTTNFFSIWGPKNGSAIARLALALKVPMVMSLAVVPSFDNAANSGIATYVGPNETSRGGHAVAVLGFVNNENLPEGTPAGAGGGYFIVKNSWGKCWKDGGYVYLPYAWVETYASQISSVSVN